MAEEHRLIGDVRGKGLMLGIELVKDPKTKVPANNEVKQVVTTALKSGLLVISCGESTIRIAPPLTVTQELLGKGIEILDDALNTVERNLSPQT